MSEIFIVFICFLVSISLYMIIDFFATNTYNKKVIIIKDLASLEEYLDIETFITNSKNTAEDLSQYLEGARLKIKYSFFLSNEEENDLYNLLEEIKHELIKDYPDRFL